MLTAVNILKGDHLCNGFGELCTKGIIQQGWYRQCVKCYRTFCCSCAYYSFPWSNELVANSCKCDECSARRKQFLPNNPLNNNDGTPITNLTTTTTTTISVTTTPPTICITDNDLPLQHQQQNGSDSGKVGCMIVPLPPRWSCSVHCMTCTK
jgi:hypothetical protein